MTKADYNELMELAESFLKNARNDGNMARETENLPVKSRHEGSRTAYYCAARDLIDFLMAHEIEDDRMEDDGK